MINLDIIINMQFINKKRENTFSNNIVYKITNNALRRKFKLIFFFYNRQYHFFCFFINMIFI